MLILDTCTLLWLTGDQQNITDVAAQAIRAHAGQIYVSSISAFEVAIKVEKKKLKLKEKPLMWFKISLEQHGLVEIPINSEIFVESNSLPKHHKDPADRIIIATAKLNHLTVVTPDKLFSQYRMIQVCWE